MIKAAFTGGAKGVIRFVEYNRKPPKIETNILIKGAVLFWSIRSE